ncbi:hypothetical protein GGU11DRAFT_744626 [Lentinula aff. detonsa]|nr:hypothetical protein GGU11DRAFT_744626 [Lentinula aff. detonsa]
MSYEFIRFHPILLNTMTDSPSASPFFSLARELRDKIYDLLLWTPIGTALPSIPGHLLDIPERYYVNRPICDWHWRIPVSRGSCFGILYTCRQAYAEVVECIERQERHGGMSFELDIALIGEPALEERMYLGSEQIWPTWILLPLCTYPVLTQDRKDFADSLTSITVNSKCKNLHVSLRLQSELTYRWLGSGGLTRLTRNLFTMLARFLLYGPAGLSRKTDATRVWSIDTLSVNVLSTGTFTDSYSDRPHTVPIEVVEDSVICLNDLLHRLCNAGALSDRVRVVRLSVEGVLKNEWLINGGESLPPPEREVWAAYGWTIDKEDRLKELNPHGIDMTPKERHLRWSLNSCCRVQ